MPLDPPIGYERLGEGNRAIYERMREDPRIVRPKGGMVADFWDAMEEAERVRELGVWGLFELRDSLKRAEQDLGVRRTSADLTDGQIAELQAAWERGEAARLEIENEHPHLHATALIAMVSALDAMVDELVPAFQEMLIHGGTEEAMRLAREREPEAYAAVSEPQIEALKDAVRELLAAQARKPKRVWGVGADRYETALAQVRLQAPADRPIPEDLDEALAEIGALRHVLVHRGGRVDAKALEQVPSLSYTEGAFVRIRRPDYRRYSAALSCYGAEVVRRAMLGLFDDTEHDVDLTRWRGWYRINA